MGRTVGLLASVSGALAVLALASTAHAATIEVDLLDEDYVTGSKRCSLREAVSSANANDGMRGCKRTGSGRGDTILLRGGKTYSRVPPVPFESDEDANVHGDIDIAGPTRIAVRGTGRATIAAGGGDRVLHVLDGGRLEASKLELREGLANGEHGGGGILNEGRLALRSSTVIENDVAAGGGGIAILGKTELRKVSVLQNEAEAAGGISIAGGSLSATGVTIALNQAETSGGGVLLAGPSGTSATFKSSTIATNSAASGGGILASAQLGHATVTLVNSTISGNFARGSGGGFYSLVGDARMNAVTVTGNWADVNADGSGHGGGIFNPGVSFRNSIVSGNHDANPTDPVADCAGTGDLPNHNLVGLGGGCSIEGSNIGDDGPPLGVLQDNGGPTHTNALMPGSPAIGRARKKTAPARDQRGVKRDRHPDIGAYER